MPLFHFSYENNPTKSRLKFSRTVAYSDKIVKDLNLEEEMRITNISRYSPAYAVEKVKEIVVCRDQISVKKLYTVHNYQER